MSSVNTLIFEVKISLLKPDLLGLIGFYSVRSYLLTVIVVFEGGGGVVLVVIFTSIYKEKCLLFCKL